MFKVEDFQNYGKEHFEGVQNGLHAIASAYGDYTKKSFEDTKSFVEKLSGVKSIDKSEGVNFSIGFFLAFMMLGSEAKRGSMEKIRKMECVKAERAILIEHVQKLVPFNL